MRDGPGGILTYKFVDGPPPETDEMENLVFRHCWTRFENKRKASGRPS